MFAFIKQIDGIACFPVFVGREPYLPVVVDGCSDGVVNSLAVLFQPFSDSIQACDGFGLYEPLRRRTDTEHQVSSLCHDFDQGADDFFRTFPSWTWYPSPVVTQRNTAFPWEVELGFGDGFLGSLVVFVRSADCSVDHDKTRLVTTCHLSDAGHVNILVVFFTNPSAVQPKDVNLPVA